MGSRREGRRRRLPSLLLTASSSIVVAIALSPVAGTAEDVSIGQFTAVQGNVFAARPTSQRPIVIQQFDPVHSKDVVQTQPRSRAKVLLADDTLVAVGEDSSLQVVEGTHDRIHDRRVLVLKLTQGRVRILVGRTFNSPDSRLELRTPSGTVSAHEGSFAAWIEASSASGEIPTAGTGVTNIGRAPINFSASGELVTLNSGQSSVAQPRQPPSQPELFRTAMAAVSRAVQDTQVRDGLKPQSPREVLQASGGPETPSLRTAPAVPGQAQTRSKEPPLIPLTPPAVISGAATAEIAPATSATPVVTPAPAPAPAPVVAPAPTPVLPAPTPVVTAPAPIPRPAPPTVTLPVPSVPSLPSGNSGSGSSGRSNRGRD